MRTTFWVCSIFLKVALSFRLGVVGHHPITLHICRIAADRGWRVILDDYDKKAYWRDQLCMEDTDNIIPWNGELCDAVVVVKSRSLPKDPPQIYELMGSPTPVVILSLGNAEYTNEWLSTGKARIVHMLYIADSEYVTSNYIKMLLNLCNYSD